MGQYLAIGLRTEMFVTKQAMTKAGVSVQDLASKLDANGIFDLSEGDAYYYFWKMKSDVFEQQLLPLLNDLYPMLYPSADEYQEVLDKLQTRAPADWMTLASYKSEIAFQLDVYGEPMTFKFAREYVEVKYESILLSAEGKIIMECYGRQFNFLSHAMQRLFPQHPLAGALHVYITG